MPDITFPKEFLTEALTVVDGMSADKDQLQLYMDDKQKKSRELETLTRNIEREKSETVRSRRSDIENSFNSQIKAVEKEIELINERRRKAREEGVRSRVEGNTAGLKQEIESLKAQMKEFLKTNNAPGVFAHRIYYTFFSPLSIWDWVIDLLIVALLIGAIVYAYAKHVSFPVFLSILGCVILLAAIYVVISARTKGKFHNEFLWCRNVMKMIGEKQKTIKAISRNIQNDKDDTVYDLGSYDTAIQQQTQRKNELNAQKTEALYQFDGNTSSVLMGEIDAKFAPDLTALQGDIAHLDDSITTYKGKVAAAETRLNNEFMPYVGTRNLTHERLEEMIGMVDKGEAASVSDAVSRLK